MRLLLDEMWAPAIARQLRERGFDVVAASEPDLGGRYAGTPDDIVFVQAQSDGRAIVTDNVVDYERVRLEWEARGTTHYGVIYALDPPFNRHRGEAVIGQLVRALEDFLASSEAEEPLNCAHWLRPARRDPVAASVRMTEMH